jgi:hypothetical protein
VNTVRKSIAAALTGLASWGVTAHPDGIDGLEWWGLFGVLVGAFLVWLTPNEPENVNIDDRLLPYDPEPTTPERGAVAWGTVALVVIAVVALFIWLGVEPPRW